MADPNWANVKLLAMHENGADASTTFDDASDSNHTLTPGTNVQWDTAQAPTGLTSSGLFGTDGAGLDAASHADFNFGTGDFTVEWFQRIDFFDAGAFPSIYDQRNGAEEVALSFYHDENGDCAIWVNNANLVGGGFPGTLDLDTWQHVAMCRASGTTRLFVDGVSIGTPASDANNYPARHVLWGLDDLNDSWEHNGWIAAARITKGVARYTSGFTPPVLPYEMGATAPVILVHPSDRAPAIGSTATFGVEAIGGALTYQWQKSEYPGGAFNDIGGATSRTYTIAAVTSVDQRDRYRCNVSNAEGTTTSNAATLTIGSHDVFLWPRPDE